MDLWELGGRKRGQLWTSFSLVSITQWRLNVQSSKVTLEYLSFMCLRVSFSTHSVETRAGPRFLSLARTRTIGSSVISCNPLRSSEDRLFLQRGLFGLKLFSRSWRIYFEQAFSEVTVFPWRIPSWFYVQFGVKIRIIGLISVFVMQTVEDSILILRSIWG